MSLYTETRAPGAIKRSEIVLLFLSGETVSSIERLMDYCMDEALICEIIRSKLADLFRAELFMEAI